MALTTGSRLGVYEVVSPLGSGGMGEVYRATDTRLKRDVAIKVLLPEVAQNPERLARFEREAQILASLNHPNIASIYGVEQAGDTTALVLEFIDGPTLAERIASTNGRGLPLDEALPLARQIAEALEAAHEHGIIHRDLKPANIKVRPDGTVKVLDFGLAKALEPAGSASVSSLSNSPTMTSPALMTGAGVLLGTAAYMSPEQARGRAVDKRTDIWAFGCVLFEMLTGARAFGGDTPADVLGAVVHLEPDWSRLSSETPGQIRVLLQRALVKDRSRRVSDISTARFVLDAQWTDSSPDYRNAARQPRPRLAPWRWATLALGIAGAALALVAVGRSRLTGVEASLPTLRASLLPPAGVSFGASVAPAQRLALAPDGSRLAFVGVASDGSTQLWLRSLDVLAMRPLRGTEDARSPFWSPDGRFLAYVADGKLRKVDIESGAITTICEVPGTQSTGGAWSADGTILIGNNVGPILRVSAAGGQPVAATTLDASKGHRSHWFPHLLPDGRHFLFTPVGSGNDLQNLSAASLDDPHPVEIINIRSNVKFANGELVYLEGTSLMARPFDADRVAVRGDAVPLAEDLDVGGGSGRAGAFSLSTNGVLAYQGTLGNDMSHLTWYDRAGREVGHLGEPGRYADPELSRDGKRAAVLLQDAVGDPTRHIWLIDVERGSRSRLGFNPAAARRAVWSPDGEFIVASLSRGSGVEMVKVAASGSGNDQLVLADDHTNLPESWSPDGRFILYWFNQPDSQADLWALPTFGARQPQPVRRTPFGEGAPARFSPDGRWIAYWSNESGRDEVWVTEFPESSERWLVSTDGGDWPRWSADGKELFYLQSDNKLMSVPTTGSGRSFSFGTAQPLFRLKPRTRARSRYLYDVAPDGRFLVNESLEDQGANQGVTLIVNWPSIASEGVGHP